MLARSRDSIGAVSIPTDPAGTATELRGLLDQVNARALITDADLLDAR